MCLSPFLKAFWHRYLPGRYTSRLNFVQVRPTRYGIDFKFYQAYCKPRQNILRILLGPITLASCLCFSELTWIRLYRRPNIVAVAGSRMMSSVFFPGPLWDPRCRSCDPPPPIAVDCRGTETPTALFGLRVWKKHQSGFLARFRPKTAGAGTAELRGSAAPRMPIC